MTKYLFRRLNLLLSTTLALMLVLFVVTHQFPVDLDVALTGIENPTSTQQQIATQTYKLNQPLTSQYIAYLSERLTGNIGISTTSQQPIINELKEVLPASIELAIVAAVIALVVGVPLGIWAALTKHKLAENAIMALTLTGYSIPVFWLGLTLSLWFGVKLGWLPVSGQLNLLYDIKPVTGIMLIDTLLSDSPYRISAFHDALLHLILPAITLALFPFTVVVRITKAAMNNVMDKTFIQAAAARGLTPIKVVMRHALPNAFLSITKNLSLMLGTFTSYAIVVEVIFSWPGVGNWLVKGIYQHDYTVIQGGIMTVALLIILLNILIDILYTVTNPLSRKSLYATN